MRLCLVKNPAERPPARRLLTHPFVRPAAAAAPRIRLLLQQEPPGEEGDERRQQSQDSARAELADIVRAVQAYYRRRWARSAAAGAGEGEEVDGMLLLDELDQGAAGAVPNTSGKALVGLARQLGLPLSSVRKAFQSMVKELAAELEAAAIGSSTGEGEA